MKTKVLQMLTCALWQLVLNCLITGALAQELSPATEDRNIDEKPPKVHDTLEEVVLCLHGQTYRIHVYDVDEIQNLLDQGATSGPCEVSANLIKQWDKTLGGSGDDGLMAIPAADGGYLLVGGSNSPASGDKSEDNKGGGDAWIVKIDAEGNKQWDKSYGGSGDDGIGRGVTTPDGGYLLAGNSNSDASGEKSEDSRGGNDFWIIKIDADGNKQWDKTFGGSGDDSYANITSSTDGSYLLTCHSDSPASGEKSEDSKGGTDLWVIKIDEEGNKLWDKTFGGSDYDGSWNTADHTSTPDGGYLLHAFSSSDASGDKTEGNRGLTDYWIIKLDKHGNKHWDKTLGGNGYDDMNDIISTTDGGYLLSGHSSSDASGDRTVSNKGAYDYWIIKLDAEGNQQWDQAFGSAGDDIIGMLTHTSDGNYLLSGHSIGEASADKSEDSRGGSDYWIVKIDQQGYKLWDKTFGGNDEEYYHSAILTSDGGFLLAGSSISPASGEKSESSKGGSDSWIVKIVETEAPFSIQSLALVDAETDEAIQEIKEGDTIDLAIFSSSKFSIVATTEPEMIGSVAFSLRGPFIHGHTENNAPYALFGDNPKGDYAGRFFPPGAYTFTATPYAEQNKTGSAGAAKTIHFTIINSEEIKDSQVTAFALYDAVTDQKIMDLMDGAIIHTDELSHEELTVLMHTVPDFVGSVKLELWGPLSLTRIENTKPYALFRNNSKDLFGEVLPAGAYHLKATPYTQANAQGAAGEPLEVSFTVTTDLAVSAFTLVNAETDEDITPVEDGAVIDLDALGNPSLTLRANTNPEQVDSVLFELSGQASTAINWHEYQTVGAAFAIGGCYAVTPDEGSTKGAAWNKHQIDLNHSFDFTFTIKLEGGGTYEISDGIMFVLQQTGLSVLGGGGGSLGYYITFDTGDVIVPSIGIEMDIHNNGSGLHDNSVSHIALVKNQDSAPLAGPVDIDPALENGEDRLLRVVWNSLTQQLEVYLDGGLVISYKEDFINTVFQGNPVVYFGFTGGTGGGSALQTFCNTHLIYEGPLTTVFVDADSPYSLFGDTPDSPGQDSPVDYLGEQWQPGEYTLTATPYRNGSAGMSKTIAFSVTGNSTQATSQVTMYPVPTTGIVNISYQGKEEQIQMLLLDFTGQPLRSLPLQGTIQLDLSAYRKGIYYLKVVDSEGAYMKRLVVE